MSSYKPDLDDDRLVSQALEALAQDTVRIEAPAAVEARLRRAFRSAAETAVSPAAAQRSGAWRWIAAAAVAASCVWLAYAVVGTGPGRPDPREARAESPAPTAAPPETPLAHPVPAIARTAPRTERVAASEAPPRRARTRRAPTVERFEPLYPGDPLADLDAVHLVRVSVPRSALATLGWPDGPGRGDRVELDAMVGPDGMTRAVRFVSQ
jgi:hypothetical protein